MSALGSAADQFDALSALAIGEGQAVIRRTVAVYTVIVGVACVVLGWLPGGAAGHWRHALIAAVLAWFAAWLVWRSRRRPSRCWSAAYVLGGVTVIGMTGSAVADHTVGLLIVVVVAPLIAYATFFHPHGAPLATVAATVGGSLIAARMVAGAGVPPAASLLGLVVVIVGSTWLVCRSLRSALPIEYTDGEIDPSTGLLNRAAFEYHVHTLVGGYARAGDNFLVVLAISVDQLGLLAETEGPAAARLARIGTARAVRESVRRDAVVARPERDLFLVADVFAVSDTEPLTERIRAAIVSVPPRLTASIGAAIMPVSGLAEQPPDLVVDHIVEAATAALALARRNGGDQSRRQFCSAPAWASGDGPVDDADDAP